MPTIKSDIVIVGAGLIGSALSQWLAKNSKHSITLIERSSLMKSPVTANQRVVALGALATNFLDDIGVLEKLDSSQSHPYRKMFVWDENSDGELLFDSSNTGESFLGHMIDAQVCTYQLQQAAANSRVNCHFDVQAQRLELNDEGASLETSCGRFDAKLLIAADGSHSWARQQAKIFANHQDYNQQGIVATIETEKSHQDCAWQCFLSTGPVAVLPLAGNQSSIVWSADNALAEQLLAMNDEDFSRALSNALQGRLGLVTQLSKRQAFPLGSLRAERYFKRNFALVGDAAHSIHPLAGQGANLGFKDIRVLGEILAGAKTSMLGSPRLLSKYQYKRQPDNNQTDLLMSGLHQAYKIEFPALMLARGLGMNLINSSDVLRNALARQAMGL